MTVLKWKIFLWSTKFQTFVLLLRKIRIDDSLSQSGTPSHFWTCSPPLVRVNKGLLVSHQEYDDVEEQDPLMTTVMNRGCGNDLNGGLGC